MPNERTQIAIRHSFLSTVECAAPSTALLALLVKVFIVAHSRAW